jgi:hypothetical protein
MTNQELWERLAEELGLDPGELVQNDERLGRYMDEGCRTLACTSGSLSHWLSRALSWHAQPQGYDYWEDLYAFLASRGDADAACIRDGMLLRALAREFRASRI